MGIKRNESLMEKFNYDNLNTLILHYSRSWLRMNVSQLFLLSHRSNPAEERRLSSTLGNPPLQPPPAGCYVTRSGNPNLHSNVLVPQNEGIRRKNCNSKVFFRSQYTRHKCVALAAGRSDTAGWILNMHRRSLLRQGSEWTINFRLLRWMKRKISQIMPANYERNARVKGRSDEHIGIGLIGWYCGDACRQWAT